jgi:bifunctional non-homologous end joining protein LigD
LCRLFENPAFVRFAEAPFIYSEHLTGDGQEMFEHAAKLGWEDVVSKNAMAPYRSDRNEALAENQNRPEEQIPAHRVCEGSNRGRGPVPRETGGKDLVYMGKAGPGWSRTVSSQIRKRLDTVVSPKARLIKPVKKPEATWVEPKFFADVEYRDITSQGLLRQSSYNRVTKAKCPYCFGVGWVCENHPHFLICHGLQIN